MLYTGGILLEGPGGAAVGGRFSVQVEAGS